MGSDQVTEITSTNVALSWESVLRALNVNRARYDEVALSGCWFDYHGDLLFVLNFQMVRGAWRIRVVDESGEESDYILDTVVANNPPPLNVRKEMLSRAERESSSWAESVLIDAHAVDKELTRRHLEELSRKQHLLLREEAERRRIQAVADEQQKQREELVRAVELEYADGLETLFHGSVGSIGPDLRQLAPKKPSWDELMKDARGHEEQISRLHEIRKVVSVLQAKTPIRLWDYTRISSSFREILEPQCAVAIGRVLDSMSFNGIAPSYMAALTDLGLPHHAAEIGKKYWSRVENVERPEYFINAYLRVARATGDQVVEQKIKEFAARRRIEIALASRGFDLPSHLVDEKRTLLVKVYG